VSEACSNIGLVHPEHGNRNQDDDAYRCNLPLSLRKTNLSSAASPAYSSLSTSRAKSAGIYSASPVVWASKASSRSAAIAPIPPGKCRHWVKTKNPAHPAYSQVRDQLLVSRPRKSRAKP